MSYQEYVEFINELSEQQYNKYAELVNEVKISNPTISFEDLVLRIKKEILH
jgi:hypothetical protein